MDLGPLQSSNPEPLMSAWVRSGHDVIKCRVRLPKKRTSTFTDSSFHDIGSAQNEDVGRGKLFPNSTTLRYAFKTPTLRDVARRGPYMHDGSMPTLLAVIDLYDRGGIDRPSRAIEIYPLGLSDVEKADLIAFLETLTGRSDVRPSTVLPR